MNEPIYDQAAAFKYYPDIYSLKPDYETEQGWWKLKWRPLWKKTFRISLGSWQHYGLGFRFCFSGAHNGWGRSFDQCWFDFHFLVWELRGWVRWNYIVMAEGPSDMGSVKWPIVGKMEKAAV
jgi:hypothetical protein